MTLINRFIRSLRDEQKTALRNYLSLSVFREETSGKEKQLFQLLLDPESEGLDDAALSKAIYGTKPDSNYRKLKSRLFQRVLDALIQDVYIANDERIGELDHLIVRLKRKMLAFRVLYRNRDKDFTDVLNHLLSEIVTEARRLHVYDVLMEALHFKKYTKSIRQGPEEFEKVQAEIEHCERCFKASTRANDHYYKIILNQNFYSKLSEEELQATIEKNIAEVERDYVQTGSPHVLYFLQFMRLANYERQKNYRVHVEVCEEIIALIKKHSSIFRKERLGYVYDNLCQSHVNLGDFENAIRSAQAAQKYYLKDSFATVVSKEQEMLANFYAGKYERAHQLVKDILRHPSSDTGEFRRDKYLYYSACCCFMSGDYQEAIRQVSRSMELSKDKSSWDMWLRILRIMILIEMQDLQQSAMAIEALRKHIERTSARQSIRQRDLLVYKALHEYEQEGFEPVQPPQKLNDLLASLAIPEGPVAWNCFSPELIPFHCWLSHRIEQKDSSISRPFRVN